MSPTFRDGGRMAAAAAKAAAQAEHLRAARLAAQAEEVLERTSRWHQSARRRQRIATWQLAASTVVLILTLVALWQQVPK